MELEGSLPLSHVGYTQQYSIFARKCLGGQPSSSETCPSPHQGATAPSGAGPPHSRGF